tara:strand:- start:15 stop:827 length:813 start_codon:yes stop_codon:yes gene_type:complete
MNNFNFIYWDFSPYIFYSDLFQIRVYSILFGLGILYVYLKTIKVLPSKKHELESFLFKTIIFTIIFSRIFHCIFYQYDYYSNNLVEIFLPINFNEMTFVGYQGLSSHGGMLGLLLSFIFLDKKFFCINEKLKIFDVLIYQSLILMFLIRIGNLFNSEIVGKECFELFCFIFPAYDLIPRYPAQLFEAIIYLSIFFIFKFRYVSKFSKLAPGFISILILFLLSLSRFFIEFLKVPNTNIDLGFLNIAQILTIMLAIFSLIIFFKIKTNLFK